MFPYTSPEYCARCGSINIASNWKVARSTQHFNLLGFLTNWFGIPIPRYAPETFDVPVCSKCEAQLARIKKTTRNITISLAVFLGLLLGIVFLVKGVRGDQLIGGLLITVFVILFGALVGVLGGIGFGLVIQEALNYEFCEFDGQYYHFKNLKFRREFAQLNPALVKRKKK